MKRKPTKSVPQKKSLAMQAMHEAMGLAGTNASKMKSIKIKVKFSGGSSKPVKKRRQSGRSSRGGY